MSTMPFDSPVSSEESASPPQRQVKRAGLLARLHRHMRGRYHWAVLLGILLMPAGVYFGYKSSVPQYRSNAMLRITPLTLRILYAQADVAPSIFDGFVDVQVNIMRSRSIVESLLRNPEWIEACGDKPSPDPEVFLRNLEIVHPTRSEIINISYTDRTPRSAMMGVRMLIEEYLKIHGDRKGNQRILATEERSTTLAATMKEIRQRMAEIEHRYGTDDLKQLHTAKTAELSRIEVMLKDTEINLLLAEAALGNADVQKNMPISEIASTDDILRKLIDEAKMFELQLIDLQRVASEEHDMVVTLKSKIDKLNRQIEERASAFRNFRRTSFVNNIGVLEGAPTPAAVDALRVRRDKLQKMYNDSLERCMETGRQSLLIGNLNEEFKLNKERLAENQTKLEQLRVDSAVIGQINIINEGDLPPLPLKDRRKVMALTGGAGAFFGGFGIVTLWSLLDRRIRRLSDLRCAGIDLPVIGKLPLATANSREARFTPSCMQHALTSIQIDAELREARVFALTSPQSGSGNSEVASALAYAFAASGKRTLLIDFDLLNAGLTRSWCRSDGFIANASPVGLKEALQDAAFETEDLGTPVPCLSFLPNNSATAGGSLQGDRIAALFQRASEKFDIVLVDTAATGTCLETLLIAREAESVLLSITPSTTDPELRECTQALQRAGASVGGILYNRASLAEFRGTPMPPESPEVNVGVCPPGILTNAIICSKVGP